MFLLNSYICPNCNKQFPLFIRPYIRINRGLLTPHLKCPYCSQICRPKIDVSSAIWIWPLTIILFAIWIYTLRTIFDYKLTISYILLDVVSLVLFNIGLRRGFKLVKVDKQNGSQRKSYKWILPAGGLILFSLFWGYYTHNWHNILIGNAVGLIVWGFYYRFSNRSKKT